MGVKHELCRWRSNAAVLLISPLLPSTTFPSGISSSAFEDLESPVSKLQKKRWSHCRAWIVTHEDQSRFGQGGRESLAGALGYRRVRHDDTIQIQIPIFKNTSFHASNSSERGIYVTIARSCCGKASGRLQGDARDAISPSP